MGIAVRNMFLVSAVAVSFAAQSFAANVEVRRKDSIGNYLVDDKGMTLYLFRKEFPGRPVLGFDNGYAGRWQAFYAAKVGPWPGLQPDAFGTIIRSDGTQQTTYKGAPLFRFTKDNIPGDTNGNGAHDIWFVAVP